MRTTFTVLTLSFCTFFGAFAQKEKIILNVKELIEKSKNSRSDSSKTHKYANEAISLSQTSDSYEVIAEAMVNKAKALKYYNQYRKTISYYDKAAAAYRKAGKKMELAEVLSTSGRVYYELGAYEDAMERYLRALDICEELEVNNSVKGWVLRYIGSIFKRQKDYPKALSYYRRAHVVFNEIGDYDGMASALNNIGNVYGEMGNETAQMSYYQKALKITEAQDLKWRSAIILGNIGDIHSDRGNYDEALRSLDKAYYYLIHMENQDYTFIASTLESKAYLFMNTNDTDSALFYLKQAESYIKKTEKKQKLELTNIYGMYSDVYKTMGDYKMAYDYQQKYMELNISLENHRIAAEVQRLEFQHDLERTKQERDSDMQLKQAEFANERSITMMLTIGLLIIIVFTVVVWIQKNQLSHAYKTQTSNLKREKELNKMRSRFVAVASHQFRTPLTVIKASMSLFDMKKEQLDNDTKSLVEKLTNRVNGQVDTMTLLMDQVLILGKINEGNISLTRESVDVVKACEDICEDLNRIQEDGREAAVNVTGTPVQLDLDPGLFKHALSNILSNAFKYSQDSPAPEVNIRFEDNKVKIGIKDYGVGIPQEDIDHLFEPFFRASNVKNISGTGLGTAVAQEYIELMNGKLSVTSEKGKGSEFTITFTVPETTI